MLTQEKPCPACEGAGRYHRDGTVCWTGAGCGIESIRCVLCKGAGKRPPELGR